MPITLLIIPVVFLLVFSIILFDKDMYKSFLSCISIIICIIVWVFRSMSMPTEIYRTETVTTRDVNGASVIAYKNYDNQMVMVNLNKVLEKNIPTGTKVKVGIFQRKYLGLFYNENMIPDKYMVLHQGD